MSRGNKHKGRGLTPADAVSGHVDDWEDLAVDYIDDRLDPKTKAAIDAHLEGCAECAGRLRVQKNVLTFLQGSALEEAPAGMEDQVMDEVLFPSRPVSTVRQPASEQPSRWSIAWRRKIRPWVPATVAVVALLAAVVSYGVIRSDSDQTLRVEATTTVADTREKAAGEAGTEEAMNAMAATSTTAGATTLVGSGAPSTTTAAAQTSTTTTMAAYDDATAVQDRKTMIADLKDAGAPVYFYFDATSLALTGGDSAAAGTAVAHQITALTGLEPLDQTLTLDGPTFAAYVPRDDATALVDLLRSIGTNLQLTVNLAWQPGGKNSDGSADAFANILQQRKSELPELSAYRTPQPAVSSWSFTTSTLVPGADRPPGSIDAVTPDEAGTHVLVVIYVRR